MKKLLTLIIIFLSLNVSSQLNNSELVWGKIHGEVGSLNEINLFDPLEIDAKMIEIATTNSVYNAAEVTGKLKNAGISNITELEIKWQVSGEDIHTTIITDILIASEETYVFVCSELFFFSPGYYTLEVLISKVNGVADMNPNDNSAVKVISVVENLPVYRIPFIEEFSSSSCGPCASFHTGFVPWCEENADNITLLKYPMAWPGLGDPYYTSEGEVRRVYYGVSAVPDLYGNGAHVNQHTLESFFAQASQLTGVLSIAGDYAINGTTININANILPYQNLPTLRLYIAIFEYITTGNVSSNGETEFHNVMIKMVPDAFGTDINLSNMEVYQFSQSIDLAGTNVEEYDDLGIVFFIQNNGSKEVYQSTYGKKDYIYSSDARLSEIRVNNTPIEEFDANITSYTVELEQGQKSLVPVTASPMAGNPIITFDYPDEVPGIVTVNVVSENLTINNTYNINLTLFPNYIPTDILISTSTIDENLPIGTEVGKLTSVDNDIDDTYTYSLVIGDGDTDNNSFTISGDSVLTSKIFNYETQSTFSVRVQTDDGNGGIFSKSFIISINNLNDMVITNIFISNPYCLDDKIGSIEIEIEEIILPLSFLWSSGQTTQNIYNVSSGSYSVTITDGEGMILNEQFILEPLPNYQETHICYLTSDGKYNVVRIDKGSENYNVGNYFIYREGSNVGVYDCIGEINATENHFTDTTINNMTRSYSYKVSMTDKCGNASIQSANHSTIHLSINSGINNEVNLYWSHYIGINTSSYSIYRKLANEDFILLEQISSNNNTYTDFPSESNSLYEYYISFEVENSCDTVVNSKRNNFSSIKSNHVSLREALHLNEYVNDENIKTYPNPVKDKLFVNLENTYLNIDKIFLFNSIGTLVFSSVGTELKSNIIEIQTFNFNTGLYNLNLYTKQGVIQRKIVIAR